MSIDLGRRVAKLNYGDPFTAYTGITITSPDSDDKFTSGNDSGRILEVEIPWASQKMADNLLAQFSGVRHQPFTATGAILDPAAEIGDSVSIDGVSGIMFRRDQRFGSLYRADISSPGDEEINHEIPYYPPIQRAVTRFGSVARGAASLAAQSMKRQDGIEEDFKELTATVTDVKAGMKAYVKNDTFNDYKESVAQLFAEVNEEDENIRSELTLHASSIEGLQEASAALMTRVSGAETALEMQSQSIDGLQTAQASLGARVDGAEASLIQKAEKSTVTDLSGKVSTIETAQASLGARVDGAEASIELNAQNINGVASSVAAVKADVIKLQGDTEIVGNLSIEDGLLKVSKGIRTSQDVYANKFHSISPSMFFGGDDSKSITLNTKCQINPGNIIFGGKTYTPTEITSTSGTVLVLGFA